MAKNPITASERRGIMAVAALALLICGAGLWLARCGRSESTVTPEDVSILLDGSSVGKSDNVSPNDSTSREGKRKKKGKLNRDGKDKGNKSYRKRSHLDEHVDSE